MTTLAVRRLPVPLWLTVLAGSALWLVAWFLALPLSTWLAFDVLGLDPATQLGQAVAFFLFDVPKVLLLLTGIVTLVSFLRSFVSPEKVRSALAGRNAAVGTVAAAAVPTTALRPASAARTFSGETNERRNEIRVTIPVRSSSTLGTSNRKNATA